MQSYASLRARGRVWDLLPGFAGISTDISLRIASFAPLAGARMMCADRGGYSMCDGFLHSVRSEGGLRDDYLFAMRRFLAENLHKCRASEVRRRVALVCVFGCLAMQIAAVAELGGDVDLIFALALNLARVGVDTEGHSVLACGWGCFHGDSHNEDCPGGLGPPLYAACGPEGSVAVVSLFIRLGAPLKDRAAFVTRAGFDFEESALCRAVRFNMHAIVCTLLRAPAMSVGHGMGLRYRCRALGSRGWESALYVAANRGHLDIVKALLVARACPSSHANSVHKDQDGVAKMSAWDFDVSDRARGALVLEAFQTCGCRCCCRGCSKIYKHRTYFKFGAFR